MSVLSYQATLKKWFAASGHQAPIVLVRDWAVIKDAIFQLLAPRDVYTIDTEAKSIPIKEIRVALSAIATTTPFGARLVILPDAERLSGPAAQALLKALEEPTTGNRWLLTTKYPRRLLPTIRSRVQIIKNVSLSQNNPISTYEVETVDFLKRLTQKNRRPLDENELAAVFASIQKYVRDGKDQTNVFRALLRLRDYYKIRAAGGNEKLAGDVLLASLVELESGR